MARLEDLPRRPVPRWRPSALAAALGEMVPHERIAPDLTRLRENLQRRKEGWDVGRGRLATVELFVAALLAGDSDTADAVAQHLGDLSADPALQRLVASVHEAGAATPTILAEEAMDHRDRIRALRYSLRLFVKNPLVWVDLAREYASLGQNPSAERAIQAALHLAPSSRFVLRSAARFYLHAHKPEKAEYLLRRNQRTRQDPWLQASLIAAEMVLQRTPGRVRDARSMVESARFAPHDVAELGVALATLEAEAGKRSRARRLARQSLLDPTENTIAQAAWIDRRIGGIPEVTENPTLLPRSSEARAWEYIQSKDWTAATRSAALWLHDEPFSSRPAHLGSFVATVGAGDFHLGAEIAQRGLIAHPHDPVLLNNLAVALGTLGRLDEAIYAFTRIQIERLNSSETVAWYATRGLVLFRGGMIREGRDSYRIAINLADQHGLEEERAMALLFLAREEVSAASKSGDAPTEAGAAVEAAVRAWSGRHGPNAAMARGVLDNLQA